MVTKIIKRSDISFSLRFCAQILVTIVLMFMGYSLILIGTFFQWDQNGNLTAAGLTLILIAGLKWLNSLRPTTSTTILPISKKMVTQKNTVKRSQMTRTGFLSYDCRKATYKNCFTTYHKQD